MVHPRLRGELSTLKHPHVIQSGSSPLTRGTRITAANPDNSYMVHPRLRGELTSSRFAFTALTGSSPLTRGTQFKKLRTNSFCRFIPAYAGNSRPGAEITGLDAVHPRLRGELEIFKEH